MRIGKRLFPYPILNSEKLYSQFENSAFSLQYDEEISEDNQYYLLNNLKCNLTDKNLIDLISAGKAEISVIVECPSTMIRQRYIIPLTSVTIKIPLTDLNGKVNVSAFVAAKEDIHDYKSEDFIDDYEHYSFEIEKHDILAADDGYINNIDFNDQDDDKHSSIFIVIKDTSIKDSTMQIDYDSDKIQISLPESEWNMYDKTKRIEQYKNLYFSIIAVPALSYSLSKLQQNDPTVDLLKMDYRWFNSFAEAYKNLYGEELTDDEFAKMNTNFVAQKILGTPVVPAIEKIFEFTIGMKGDEDDGD